MEPTPQSERFPVMATGLLAAHGDYLRVQNAGLRPPLPEWPAGAVAGHNLLHPVALSETRHHFGVASEEDESTNVREIARRVHPERTWGGKFRRLVFVLRSVRHRKVAQGWYLWLDHSFMAPAAEANPALYKKIIRPYVTPAWDEVKKLRVLRYHYHFVAMHLWGDAFYRVLTYPGLPLLEFGPVGERYRVAMGYDRRCNKEGEISLLLFSQKHGVRVSSLTGVIVRDSVGGGRFLIGCVQGLPAAADKNIIKEISRTMHGLRPKSLLLFLAQQLAAEWKLRGLRGVGDRTHISRHAAYALNSTRRPKLTYDQFWQESGGALAADGFFDLPLTHIPRPDEKIKSGKRSLYRRRYLLMEELGHEFRGALRVFAGDAV